MRLPDALDLFRQRLDLFREVLRRFRVLDRTEFAQTLHMSVLFTRNVGEQLAALDNLLDCLSKVDRHPFVLGALAGSLEDLDESVRVVGGLQSRLPFGADASIHLAYVTE